MKKLIILFSVITLTFTSCGSDDDSSTSQDQFIGDWKYFTAFEDGVEVDLDVCEDETTLAVSANGTFIAKSYEDNLNGDCVLEDTSSGTWENIGNGRYSTGNDGDTYVLEVRFEENRMYVEDVNLSTIYTDVYIRQ